MAIWECIASYRRLRFTRLQRWPHQLLLILINSILLKLLLPIAAAGVALWAAEQQVGLMNWYSIHPLVVIAISVVLLDLGVYAQHLVSHRWNWFWRIHRTHHIDTDFDLTTGLRFHPIEIIISMLYKMFLVMLLGVSAAGVLIFEIVLNGSALFNHSNIRLPVRLEAFIRHLIVTPEMHRIHHSTLAKEHNTNYGFFLSCWDRMFRSYTDKASENDRNMAIGLDIMRDADDRRIDRILMIPFRKD